jgi:cysteinyl-tRNA synthetase
MSLKYLGESLDIHGGGQDLVFPHHENEIAQSECFTGVEPFVKYWLHNGMVQFGEEKMSKSLGNLITIKEALEKYSADALRIFVLSSHYRSPLTYSEAAIEAAKRGANRLEQAANNPAGKGKKKADIDVSIYKDKFVEAMDDDFNTPQAIAVLFDLAKEINRASEAGCDSEDARKMLKNLSGVLGLVLEPSRQRVEPMGISSIERVGTPTIIQHPPKKGTPEENEDIESIINSIKILIGRRDELRKAKKWQEADEIRAKLEELGILLEDTPQGTAWRRKR